MSTNNLLVPTERLRERLRSFAEKSRENKRNCKHDALRFGLGEIQLKVTELENLTEKDVTALAARIKRRKHATAEDMFRLSHAFLQGNENIEVFAKIPGAIQMLVKELTGKDSSQQIMACETICNFSLGEEPVCEKIASLAGSYLITYLDTSEFRLKQTSLWVILNILATGGKGTDILIGMEIFLKLLTLYLSANEATEIIRDAAIGLDLIVSGTELRPIDKEAFLEKFHMKNPQSPGSEYHLKMVFNSQVIGPEILKDHQLDYLISLSVSNLSKFENLNEKETVLKIIYSIRVLSNLLAIYPNALLLLLQHAERNGSSILEIFDRIYSFGSIEISMESFWLLRNLLECQTDESQKAEFLRNLKVPKILGLIC